MTQLPSALIPYPRPAPASGMERSSQQRGTNLIIWAVLCGVVGAAALVYFSVGHNASRGGLLVMPLDDVYIHFQYARMTAAGLPFRYNPGDPPTSGATSLLYPFLLAAGYLIGFQGERLALWAVGIGVLTWIGSTWLVYRLIGHPNRSPLRTGIGLLMAIAFALSGGISWAFASGMETGLTIFATLLTLYMLARQNSRAAILAATLAALVRPEGLVIAVGAIGYLVGKTPRRRWPLLLIPILAGLLQPILNLALTGSVTASGMQSKSFLYNVPFSWPNLIGSVGRTFLDTWRELFFGTRIEDGVVYISPLLGLIALLYLAYRLINHVWLARGRMLRIVPRPRVGTGLIVTIAFWMLGLVGSVSILETAFWQFKRYQQPLFALIYVLAGWALVSLAGRLDLLALVVAAFFVFFSVVTAFRFIGYYGDNVFEVASLQIPMARFVAANTPPDARIGVHDIGVMRYIGDRATYDVVGLTTPGAAQAWRSGPGAVFETMRRSPFRPDYLALYTEARGLSYFQNTALFADVLARFPSTNPVHNVASASAEQIVTRLDWNALPPAPPRLHAGFWDFTLSDSLNVADLADEAAHQYQWWQNSTRNGFPTELYQLLPFRFPYEEPATQTILDGGRLINGGEAFTIRTRPGQDLLWIARVHAHDEALLKLSVDGQPLATRVQPGGLGGQWLEIETLIPGSMITSEKTRLRVEVAATDGFYMAYYHWFYQGRYQTNAMQVLVSSRISQFGDGIVLIGPNISIDPQTRQLRVDVDWWGDPSKTLGDAKVFVHLYANPADAPVTQFDSRPGNGTLPPANWLPGFFADTYFVPLPTVPGIYQIAIGMYDPTTNQRLPVSGPGADRDNRLFIGTIIVGL